MPLIYVVDDKFDIIHSINTWLKRKHYEARGFSESESLYKGLELALPDVILLDVKLGNEDGRDICREIKRRYESKIPVILYSGAYDSLKDLKDNCADDFVKKDATLRELTAKLQQHLKPARE